MRHRILAPLTLLFLGSLSFAQECNQYQNHAHWKGRSSGTCFNVITKDNYAYAARSYDGLYVYEYSDLDYPDLVATLRPPNPGSWTKAIIVNDVYIVRGSPLFDSPRLYSIDISNPTSPAVADSCLYTNSAFASVSNDCFASMGNYIYLSSGSNLHVFSLSGTTISHTGDTDIGSNIMGIERYGDHIIICCNNNYVYIYSINNPTSPSFVAGYMSSSTPISVSASDGIAYIGQNDNTILVLNISDPQWPYAINTHPVDHPVRFVHYQDAYLWVILEGDYIQILNVHDPSSPYVARSHRFDRDIHDFHLSSIDNALLIASDIGVAALRHPLNTHIAVSETGIFGYLTCGISEDDLLILNRSGQLQTYSIAAPSTPTSLGYCSSSFGLRALAIEGDVCVGAGSDLFVFSISNTSQPEVLGQMDLPATCTDIVVRDGIAYVLTNTSLYSIDISDPNDLTIMHSIEAFTYGRSLLLINQHMYVGDALYGIHVIGISPVNSFVYFGFGGDTHSIMDLTLHGDHIYATNQNVGYDIFTTDTSGPDYLYSYRMFLGQQSSALFGDCAFTTALDFGCVVMDIRDPLTPRAVGHIPATGQMTLIIPSENGVYIYDSDNETSLLYAPMQCSEYLAIDDHNNDIIDQEVYSPSLLTMQYSNPYHLLSGITYTQPRPGHVKITIYDLAGRVIANLVDSPCTAKANTVAWNGRTESGRVAPSGVYLIQMKTDKSLISKKIVLSK